MVCGGANNQLATPGVADLLAERDVLYCPDYCANAGGVIQVADELQGFVFERARQRTEKIFDTMLRVLREAADAGRDAGRGRRPDGRAPDGRGGLADPDPALRIPADPPSPGDAEGAW